MNSPKEQAKYWKRVSTTVNYDGVSEWYRASGCWRKFFWTIIMIGTVVTIVYYTYTVTTQYLAHPSATQLAEQPTERIQFPNVTICHTARFNKTYVDQNIVIPSDDIIFAMGHNVGAKTRKEYPGVMNYFYRSLFEHRFTS